MPFVPPSIAGICANVRKNKVASKKKDLVEFVRQEKKKRNCRVVDSDSDSDFEFPEASGPSRKINCKCLIMFCVELVSLIVLLMLTFFVDFGAGWNLLIVIVLLIVSYSAYVIKFTKDTTTTDSCC